MQALSRHVLRELAAGSDPEDLQPMTLSDSELLGLSRPSLLSDDSEGEYDVANDTGKVDTEGQGAQDQSRKQVAHSPRPRGIERRCHSAPCLGELTAISMDLEAMTVQAIAMFRQGRQQEALDFVVAFTDEARRDLGTSHPTYINALATVAALVDQMGGSEEAGLLLQEAEELHEENEMEAVAIEIEEAFTPVPSDSEEDDDLRAAETPSNQCSMAAASTKTGSPLMPKSRRSQRRAKKLH